MASKGPTEYEAVVRKVAGCERCLKCVPEIRRHADAGRAFVPLPDLPSHGRVASGRLDVLFVALEPTTNAWAEDGRMSKARRAVKAGMRNHGPTALHVAVREYLPGVSYLLTDAAKCAMPAEGASRTRGERLRECRPHLLDQIRALRPRVVVAIGSRMKSWLDRALREAAPAKGTPWPEVVRITHFSRNNAGARARIIAGAKSLPKRLEREDLLPWFAKVHREQDLPSFVERRDPFPNEDSNLVQALAIELREVAAALVRSRA